MVNQSLSTMVRTAVLRVPRVAPPVGLERVRMTVSLGSSRASFMIGIVKVPLVWPAAKVKVPDVAM